MAPTPFTRLQAHMARHYPAIGCDRVADAHPDAIEAALSGPMLNKVATLLALKAVDPAFYATGMTRSQARKSPYSEAAYFDGEPVQHCAAREEHFRLERKKRQARDATAERLSGREAARIAVGLSVGRGIAA